MGSTPNEQHSLPDPNVQESVENRAYSGLAALTLWLLCGDRG